MSSLELISELKGDYAHWRDARGHHWFEIHWAEPAGALHVVRLEGSQLARWQSEGPAWAGRFTANLRAERPDQPDLSDRFRRLRSALPSAEELGLLSRVGARAPGALPIYEDWLASQGRTAEASFLAEPPRHNKRASWRFDPAGLCPPHHERRPLSGPVVARGTVGIPDTLEVARGWHRDPDCELDVILSAIQDELAICPWIRGLRVAVSAGWARPWPWSLEAFLERLPELAWVERLELAAFRPSDEPNLDPILALPRLRSLSLDGRHLTLHLPRLLHRMPPGRLDTLRVPFWAPSPRMLARVGELGIDRLHLMQVDLDAAASLPLRDVTLEIQGGDVRRLGGPHLQRLQVLAGLEPPPSLDFGELSSLDVLNLPAEWLAGQSLRLPAGLDSLRARALPARIEGVPPRLWVSGEGLRACELARDQIEELTLWGGASIRFDQDLVLPALRRLNLFFGSTIDRATDPSELRTLQVHPDALESVPWQALAKLDHLIVRDHRRLDPSAIRPLCPEGVGRCVCWPEAV